MNSDATTNGTASRKGLPAPCPDFARVLREGSADESLFDQIIGCFAGRLASFARYRCGDETLGQDAFQEAMLTAFTKLDSFRGDSPIEPWLRRIVISSCSRLRRGKKNDPTVNLPFDPERGDGASAPSEGEQGLQLEIAESLELLREEIELLEEPNRTLLKRHDIEEVPIVELAAEFALTAEAVKSRLKRSRAQVRDGILSREIA